MNDKELKRLASRRSFLKGSALLAASTLAAPAVLSAQQPSDAPKHDEQDRPDQPSGAQGKANDDKANDGTAPSQQAKEGDGAETFIGADGRPYRVCPQCGSNMYKQGRTWTCENCGYSYDE
jgi:anaerobic selenocysteine-containing dehydrogenase